MIFAFGDQQGRRPAAVADVIKDDIEHARQHFTAHRTACVVAEQRRHLGMRGDHPVVNQQRWVTRRFGCCGESVQAGHSAGVKLGWALMLRPQPQVPMFRFFVLLVLLSAPAAARPATLAGAIVAEINFARTSPQAYAETLRRHRASYNGRHVDDPDEPASHTSKEGVAAVDEAIAFLERQPPLPPLASAPLLALAAADHAAAQRRSGKIGHFSANGDTPGQRVVRRGGGPYVAETIAYGFAVPVAVVRQLIIDDGVADRSHRAVIFDSRFRYAGVGCGRHPVYSAMCVIDFSPSPDGRMSPRSTAGQEPR